MAIIGDCIGDRIEDCIGDCIGDSTVFDEPKGDPLAHQKQWSLQYNLVGSFKVLDSFYLKYSTNLIVI
jgi:hypothetical protein